jgi:D-alanyl-D-alanine dipeptidase
LLSLSALKSAPSRFTSALALLSVTLSLAAAQTDAVPTPIPISNEELVDIKKVDPTILVELRYAGSKNIAGRPLYRADMPALVRASVAQRLVKVQAYLQQSHYGLKIWDAYRPPDAQAQLWQLFQNAAFVANPKDGRGSLHTWGVAVDATLVDDKGNEIAMPTDFDAFTPAASLHYAGNDPEVALHLRILQAAMKRGGFYGLRTEWWHFIAYNWKKFGPLHETKFSSR